MTQLSASELRKYDWRPEIFIRKLQDNSPFEVKGGKKVILIPPKGVEKTLRNGSSKDLNDLLFGDTNGNTFKLTDFVKNKDFGGRGEGSGTAKEDMALKSLREQIAAAKKELGQVTIPIKIDNKTYNVCDVVSTPGTPKSDFHLIDLDGKEIAWISHKDGKTEKDFQQWGGVSQTKEPKLYNHPEVQKFIKDIKTLYSEGLPNATTLARKITDEKLKMMSVYGNEYGRTFSRQNTTLMLQGSIKLEKKSNDYAITAYHTHVNGDKMIGGYDPVFMAIYKGDRSDFGIRGTRIVIAPAGCRKVTSVI